MGRHLERKKAKALPSVAPSSSAATAVSTSLDYSSEHLLVLAAVIHVCCIGMTVDGAQPSAPSHCNVSRDEALHIQWLTEALCLMGCQKSGGWGRQTKESSAVVFVLTLAWRACAATHCGKYPHKIIAQESFLELKMIHSMQPQQH